MFSTPFASTLSPVAGREPGQTAGGADVTMCDLVRGVLRLEKFRDPDHGDHDDAGYEIKDQNQTDQNETDHGIPLLGRQAPYSISL